MLNFHSSKKQKAFFALGTWHPFFLAQRPPFSSSALALATFLFCHSRAAAATAGFITLLALSLSTAIAHATTTRYVNPRRNCLPSPHCQCDESTPRPNSSRIRSFLFLTLRSSSPSSSPWPPPPPSRCGGAFVAASPSAVEIASVVEIGAPPPPPPSWRGPSKPAGRRLQTFVSASRLLRSAVD